MSKLLQRCQSVADLARLIADHLDGELTDPIMKEVVTFVGVAPKVLAPIMRGGNIAIIEAYNAGGFVDSDNFSHGIISNYAVVHGFVTEQGAARIQRMLARERRLRLKTYRASRVMARTAGLQLRPKNDDPFFLDPGLRLDFAARRDLERSSTVSSALKRELVNRHQVILWDPQPDRRNVLWPALAAAFR